MGDLSGQNIRGYELLESIGEGGFATVYRAIQTAVDREVAIKVILPEHANQPEFIRRFEVEAQVVARLEHPHIIPLYDYWREPTGAYLVMRWLRGGSLSEALEQRGPFSLQAAAQALDQIAAALTVAHRNNVIHRDLKPGNILLDEDGNAYLADFGIAKSILDETPDTAVNTITGTFGYIAPEQLSGNQATVESDIYSLGIILYEMLAGRHPFAGASVSQMIMKQMNERLPDLHKQIRTLPLGVNHILHRATAKDPADRYQDALSMATDFRLVVSGRGDTLQRGKTPTEAEMELFDVVLNSAIASNPYKGLRAFDEADANDFFGRDTLTRRMIQRLGEAVQYSRFLAVIGPSGSGKSSVVKAGLIPALRHGALPGSESWFYAEMSPGAHPLEELQNALTRVATTPVEDMEEQLARDDRGLMRVARMILPNLNNEIVLVIDQFEELFTQVNERAEIAHFLNLLVAAVTDPKSCVRVIITLRADFYDRPLMYAQFSDLLRERDEVVVPLSPAELEEAVVGPARRVGARLEPGLVSAIVAEVSEHHGMLPMLQYAMTELFDQRVDNVLTLRGYQAIGGTLGALARRADEIYAGLDDDEKKAARQLFLRLVALGDGTENTRRRVFQSELVWAGGEAVQRVIEAFGKSRLLTFDREPTTREPTVEVAHEAIIRQWGLLREWLDDSRSDVRMQRLLASDAAQWMAAKQDASYLLSGSRLEQYEAWAAETYLSFTPAEQSFLIASIARRKQQLAAEREREAKQRGFEQRAVRRLRVALALLAVTLVAMVIFVSIAVSQSQRANTAEAQAAQCLVTPASSG